jgi:hypothetical protein
LGRYFSPCKYAVKLQCENVYSKSQANPDNQYPDDWSSIIIVFRFLAGQGDPFSSQPPPPRPTDSGAHPNFYSIRTESLSLEVKPLGRKGVSPLPTVFETKNGWSSASTAFCACMAWKRTSVFYLLTYSKHCVFVTLTNLLISFREIIPAGGKNQTAQANTLCRGSGMLPIILGGIHSYHC